MVCETQVSYADPDVCDVVPDVGQDLVVANSDRSLEARQCYVILRGVKTAETHVVPELARVYTALDESLVKSEGDLGLICIEMITGDRGNSFGGVVVEG